MGVLDASKSFKLPFFYALPPPLGSRNPPGRTLCFRFWAEGRGIRADSSRLRPLLMYPLADKGLGPVLGPLSLYPLAISALSYVPFGRFGPICCHFGPYRSTLWPTASVGGPYRSTLWPFRRLATYPSYPYYVGTPCPRTLPSFQA